MIIVNLQLLAHKKGVGSTRTAAIPNPSALAPRKATARLLSLAIFWSASAAQKSILASMSAKGRMIRCLLWPMARSGTNGLAGTRSKSVFIRPNNRLKQDLIFRELLQRIRPVIWRDPFSTWLH